MEKQLQSLANEKAALKSKPMRKQLHILSQIEAHICGEWFFACHLGISSQQGRTLLGAEAGYRRVAIIIVILFSTQATRQFYMAFIMYWEVAQRLGIFIVQSSPFYGQQCLVRILLYVELKGLVEFLHQQWFGAHIPSGYLGFHTLMGIRASTDRLGMRAQKLPEGLPDKLITSKAYLW